MISVLIADDQKMMRQGLRALLEGEPDIRVVADVGDGQQAVEQIRALQPDVALMDIRMPVLNGIAATEQLVREGCTTRILVLTTFDLDEYVFDALKAGATGFLLKDGTAETLIAGIRVLARGDALLAPEATKKVIREFVKRPSQVASSVDSDVLTAREREVWMMIASGLTNAEIAASLTLSEATIKTHVSNLLSKLNLRDRIHAVILAYEKGFVRPVDPGST